MIYPGNAPNNTLIRPVCTMTLFCDVCNQERTFYLKDETVTDEVYACSGCEQVKTFAVR